MRGLEGCIIHIFLNNGSFSDVRVVFLIVKKYNGLMGRLCTY